MFSRKRSAMLICMLAWALVAGQVAYAQLPNSLPGGSQFNPPPPPPPPPPRIEVPKVPQIDAPLRYDYRPAPQPSFSDRVVRCLDEAAAAGVKPSRRAAYSRSCANRDD
ncbi:MAG: hypothetical protein E6G85_01215 [Alphaproteobacteria bacterium]|nr:MAG: hypothetical protein E6G85_01215 [Alphaproteobacteria bacterium]